MQKSKTFKKRRRRRPSKRKPLPEVLQTGKLIKIMTLKYDSHREIATGVEGDKVLTIKTQEPVTHENVYKIVSKYANLKSKEYEAIRKMCVKRDTKLFADIVKAYKKKRPVRMRNFNNGNYICVVNEENNST